MIKNYKVFISDSSYARLKAELVQSGVVNAYKLFISAINGVEIRGESSNVFLYSGTNVQTGEKLPVLADYLRVSNEFGCSNATISNKLSVGSTNLTNDGGILKVSSAVDSNIGFRCSGQSGIDLDGVQVRGIGNNICHLYFKGGILVDIKYTQD